MNRLFRKYRRNGAVCIASTKFRQRSSCGSQLNFAISRLLLNAVSSIHTNGTIISSAPTVSTTYSTIRPARTAGGFAAPTAGNETLVIGIRLLEQASGGDEDRDHDHHDHRLGGRVAEFQVLERVLVDVHHQH